MTSCKCKYVIKILLEAISCGANQSRAYITKEILCPAETCIIQYISQKTAPAFTFAAHHKMFSLTDAWTFPKCSFESFLLKSDTNKYMLQGHQRKDVGLVLAYFSHRIFLCAHGRKGWMSAGMLSFDSTIQNNIAVEFILEGRRLQLFITSTVVAIPEVVRVPTLAHIFSLHCSGYDPAHHCIQ